MLRIHCTCGSGFGVSGMGCACFWYHPDAATAGSAVDKIAAVAQRLQSGRALQSFASQVSVALESSSCELRVVPDVLRAAEAGSQSQGPGLAGCARGALPLADTASLPVPRVVMALEQVWWAGGTRTPTPAARLTATAASAPGRASPAGMPAVWLTAYNLAASAQYRQRVPEIVLHYIHVSSTVGKMIPSYQRFMRFTPFTR